MEPNVNRNMVPAAVKTNLSAIFSNEELLKKSTVPELMNYMRFKVFADIEPSKLKDALAKFAYVDLKNAINTVVDIINSRNFNQFELFVNDIVTDVNQLKLKAKNETTKKLIERKMEATDLDVVVKDINQIMDAYFLQKKSSGAFNVLDHLFELVVTSQEQWDTYMGVFMKLDIEQQGKYRGYRC